MLYIKHLYIYNIHNAYNIYTQCVYIYKPEIIIEYYKKYYKFIIV